jgi:quinol monooxygenase YgiN
MGMNSCVTLSGTLICANADELARVNAGVAQHIALTRAKAGCLSFELTQSDDPMIWTLSERFTDAVAFEMHQTRAGASHWAELTKGIRRDYTISGLE